MLNFITPNDDGIIGNTDSASIQNAVNAAKKSGLNKVVIPRFNERTGECLWSIDKAIILTSELEVVLDNCYIRQADGAMDNVFRNFDEDGIRKTLDGEQYGIVIRGVGNAVIDGGTSNGLTQSTSGKNGMPHVEKNNVIRFHNLRDFTLENFTIKNQRWWAVNLHYVENGRISRVNIVCDGNLRNQDGIDLRLGCCNMIIEDCFGQAGDDFIALSAFRAERTLQKYKVEGKSDDIHDIVIRNIVATSAECTVIGIRNQDGAKIYNITIDGIHDVMGTAVSKEKCHNIFEFDNNAYEHAKSPYALLRIGQDGYSTSAKTAPGDVHSLHVTNLHARTNTAVIINMDLENSYFGNIYAGEGCDRIISTRSCRTHQSYGADIRNTVFENIFFNCKSENDAVAFDFDINFTAHRLENVVINRAFLGKCNTVVNMQHDGEIVMSAICCDDVQNKLKIKKGASVFIDGTLYD